LFELVTGRPPFTGTHVKVAHAHLHQPPPSPREIVPGTDIPDGVISVIMRALAKRPEDRFPDMKALERALNALSHHSSLDDLPTVIHQRVPRPSPFVTQQGPRIPSNSGPSDRNSTVQGPRVQPGSPVDIDATIAISRLPRLQPFVTEQAPRIPSIRGTSNPHSTVNGPRVQPRPPSDLAPTSEIARPDFGPPIIPGTDAGQERLVPHVKPQQVPVLRPSAAPAPVDPTIQRPKARPELPARDWRHVLDILKENTLKINIAVGILLLLVIAYKTQCVFTPS